MPRGPVWVIFITEMFFRVRITERVARVVCITGLITEVFIRLGVKLEEVMNVTVRVVCVP